MLTAETRYRYIVYAVNEATVPGIKGTMPSALKAATTDDLTAPGRPERLTGVQSGENVVQLYWYAPSNNGGKVITAYDAEVRANCTGSWDNVDTQWTDSPTAAHDALWNLDPTDRETSACFRVRAHNSATDSPEANWRYGPWSSQANLSLQADDVARVKVVPPAVTGAAATYTTDRAKVIWEAVDLMDNNAERVSGYRVDVSENGISWEPIRGGNNTNRADDEGIPFFEYGYDGGEPRTYRVFARVAQGVGPAGVSAASTAQTGDIEAPGHAMSLMVMATGPTQIDVSWTAPAVDGGAPIDHYIVQATMQVGTAFETWPTALATNNNTETAGNFKSETTSYSHTKLKAGQTWRYRVFAANKDADGAVTLPTLTDVGDEAEVDQATTPQESKPRKPELLSVEMASTSNSLAADTTGLLLLWNAPQSPAGAAISGYQVQRMSNDGPWTTLTESPHTESLFTDYTDTEGLETDETRAYRVRAISENGVEGAWSDIAYYPQDTSHNTAPMTVGMIDPVTVTAGEMSDAMDVSGYFSDADMGDMLDYDATSDMEMYATVMVDGSMVTITGVAAGMAIITVTATDMDDAMATQTIIVTVEAPASMELTAPTDVVVSDFGNTISVTWTPGSAQNADQIKVVLFNEGVTAISDAVDEPLVAMPPTADDGSHTYNNVPAGTYTVGVASYREGEDHKLSLPLRKVTVQ